MVKKHVFLSYCHENKTQVTELRHDLIAAGEQVWWDGDIMAGQVWKLAIRAAMRDSYAVVICISAELSERNRSGVYSEIRQAIKRYLDYAPGKDFLFPVRLSMCDVPAIEIDSSRTLKDLQYIDLFPAEKWADGIARLIQTIKTAPEHPATLPPKRRGRAKVPATDDKHVSQAKEGTVSPERIEGLDHEREKIAVLVGGSLKSPHSKGYFDNFCGQCRQLGQKLIESDFEIVVGSAHEATVDRHVVEGANACGRTTKVRVVAPTEPAHDDIVYHHLRDTFRNIEFDVDQRRGNWRDIRAAQVGSADVAVLIGGGVGTKHLAEECLRQGKPALVMGAFDGTALEMFDEFTLPLRRDGLTVEDLRILKNTFNPASIIDMIRKIVANRRKPAS